MAGGRLAGWFSASGGRVGQSCWALGDGSSVVGASEHGWCWADGDVGGWDDWLAPLLVENLNQNLVGVAVSLNSLGWESDFGVWAVVGGDLGGGSWASNN